MRPDFPSDETGCHRTLALRSQLVDDDPPTTV